MLANVLAYEFLQERVDEKPDVQYDETNADLFVESEADCSEDNECND